MVIDSQVDPDDAQWDLPFYYFGTHHSIRIQAVLGLGNGDPTNDPNLSFNFINRAYEEGLLKNNTYSFQGLSGDQKYASMTIGGWSDRLFSTAVEWYDLNPADSNDGVTNWKLTFSSFYIDTYDMMEAPTPTEEVYAGSVFENDADTEFKVYGHFNTGYPFIGVDESIAPKLLEDLQHFRPDVSCELHKKWNPMGVCYWRDTCDPNLFGDADLRFEFGT